MKRVHLTNIEYDFLHNEGGDGLIAFLATLRAVKPMEVIRRAGKKKSSATIKSVTGLSRTTIEQHLPKLQEIGMVLVHSNGNIAIRSRKWSDKNLPQLNCRKLIPIMVSDKFTDTKIYSGFVRVHSRVKKQERQIGKKSKRIEVMEAFSNKKRLSQGDYRIWKKLYRQGRTLEELKSKYRSNSTISNLSFHKILKDSNLPSDCNKSTGNHFKNRLIELGLITQNRLCRLKYPNVKDGAFVANENDFLTSGGLFQGRKGVYFEISPHIEIVSNALVGTKKKQVER